MRSRFNVWGAVNYPLTLLTNIRTLAFYTPRNNTLGNPPGENSTQKQYFWKSNWEKRNPETILLEIPLGKIQLTRYQFPKMVELTLLNQSNFILGWLNGKTISLNLSHVPNSSDNFCKIWSSSCITHNLSPFSTGNNSFSETKFCRDPLQIMINIYLNFHENTK